MEVLLIGMKFLRGLALIWLGADIALRYSIDKIYDIKTLIQIIFIVFGIYAFLTYYIGKSEKYLDTIKN